MNEFKRETSETILLMTPTANDAVVAAEVLRQACLSADVCLSIDDLCQKIADGCGTVILSEEALTLTSIAQLQRSLDQQEAWSDLPIILLTSADMIRATALFSKSGNIALLERPFSRLTLIRAAEVALRSRRRQYEVRELLQQLKSSKEEADRANIAKSRFLANMSHEIRTPIGAIIGFIDLMKTNTDSETNQKYMGIIERNSQQLLRLIDDILDLSKVEAGKMSMEKIHFKLTDLLADFGSVMAFKAGEKGIKYQVKLETMIPDIISSDPVRIRQILSNVVGNAIKFTDQGSVQLKVAYKDETLKFSVIDTGVGLSGDQALRLFQPFVQADTSTTRQFGGTGLGLILSRRLAEALGGNLKLVHSMPGTGSTFTFEVKIELTQATTMVRDDSLIITRTELTAKSNEKYLQGLKVLLVEDAPDNQTLITTYLKNSGALITSAMDGVEGVEAALKNNFDVILMDVQMPRMDGHEATKKLRKGKYDKPIIALTAHAMKEERQKCIESGFTDFLTKPIQSDHLIEVLARYHQKIPQSSSSLV